MINKTGERGGVYVLTDEVLYEQFWNGDKKAADELVRRHGDLLFLFINGYLRDSHESEDLMIEALARMFAKKRPLLGEGSFRAYLYKTARHLAARIRTGRRLHISFEELSFEIQSEDLAETRLFENERAKQLYNALEKLKPEYQEVLYLIYFEEMSYQDAGKVMKKSESQITNLVHRGKQSLKKILKESGFEY